MIGATGDNVPAVLGLVLAGGSGRRMRRDKALLDYHGKPQVRWCYELLRRVCERVYVSTRTDQAREPVRASLPQIVDAVDGLGPAGGIMSAQKVRPDVAWLVVACDLPFLSCELLEHLLEHRDPARDATAYRSSHDGLPEPLCAIWEPRSRRWLETDVADGVFCPRKVLIHADTHLVKPFDARALDNVNTPDELRAACGALTGTEPGP